MSRPVQRKQNILDFLIATIVSELSLCGCIKLTVAYVFLTMGHRGQSISTRVKQFIIAKFLTNRKSIADIARECKVSWPTAKKCIEDFKAHRSMERKRGQGRKPEFSKAACARAFSLLIDEHLGARAAAVVLFKEGFTTHAVCGHTIIRHVKPYAKEIGTPITCKLKRLKRRFTEENKRQRLKFCRLHRDLTFKNVMFTDRCKFYFRHPGEAVPDGPWSLCSQSTEAYTPTHPTMLNVYGGITPQGTTRLFMVTGTTNYHPTAGYTTSTGSEAKNITIHEYYDVLMQGLLPDGSALFHGEDWVLQQDNDPTHKVASEKAVRDWNASLRKKGSQQGRVQVMKGWPPNSPDLSIIENGWAINKRRVAARKCDTFADFTQAVKEVFSKIEPKPLYRSIPKRIKQCIKAKGDRTHH